MFGVLENAEYTQADAVPVARPGEVREGAASILANVAGDGVEEYRIRIAKVLDGSQVQNLLLQVTDERLIERTGGIVQGMSQGHQHPCVRVRDAVAQCAEGAGHRVIEGDRADAGHAVADPGPQTVGAVIAQHERKKEGPGYVKFYPILSAAAINVFLYYQPDLRFIF